METEATQIRNWVSKFKNPAVRTRANQIAEEHTRGATVSFEAFVKAAEPELRKMLGMKSNTPDPVTRDAFTLMTPLEQRNHCLAGGRITD
jgi:hypothetical protein